MNSAHRAHRGASKQPFMSRMDKPERQSNIELLRIALMIMIITHHVIVHGLGLANIGRHSFHLDNHTYWAIAANCFVVVAVNVFVFISGYFGIKFKLRTLFSLFFQAASYSFLLFLLFASFNPSIWNASNVMNSLLPISRNMWWFISTYIGLYILSPILNGGVQSLDRRQFTLIMVCLLFINCFSGFFFGTLSEKGYSIFNFMVIYLIGRYVKQYSISFKSPLAFFIGITSVIFGLTMLLLHYHKQSTVVWLFAYNNPLLIISSISFFFIFKNLDIRYSRRINIAASTVLGVYMIHEYSSIRSILVGWVSSLKATYGDSEVLFVGAIALLVLSIFVTGAIIELIRKQVSNALIERITAMLKNSRKARQLMAFARSRFFPQGKGIGQ